MSGIGEGIATEAAWTLLTSGAKRLFSGRIRITSPRPHERLGDGTALGSMFSYAVRGKLRRLPADHKIWLLTADEGNEKFWPQGFFSVEFDKGTGDWHGKVAGTPKDRRTIFAVVAPPTSCDFFRYYENVGGLQGNHEPITRIPLECRNRHGVPIVFA